MATVMANPATIQKGLRRKLAGKLLCLFLPAQSLCLRGRGNRTRKGRLMKNIALLLLAPVLALTACTSLPPASPAPEFYVAYPGVQDTRILQTEDGLYLYGQWWEPENRNPAAVVLLLHGTAAHVGVYAPWANHLVEHGYALFGYDMRGWGQSQGFGRAGFTRSDDDYVQDVSLALAEVRKRYPDVPVYLQGESLGAGVALQWDIRDNEQVDGLILNAPPVVVNMKVGPLRQPDWLSNTIVWNGGLLGRMAPNAPIYSMAGIRGRWMWNKAIFDPWAKDWIAEEVNMTHSAVAASYVTNLQKISAEIRDNFDKIDTPVIVLQGSKDYLVSPKAAKRITDRAASRERAQWRFYEGRSHCALHDSDKEAVWADIVVWLDGMVIAAQQAKQDQQIGAAQ
jgi:alpha-beta hydrolase superfamily lysophospholipase